MKNRGEEEFRHASADHAEPDIVRRLVNANDQDMTVAQLAEELCKTPAAIYKRIYRGKIPAHFDGTWHILRSEYNEYVARLGGK